MCLVFYESLINVSCYLKDFLLFFSFLIKIKRKFFIKIIFIEIFVVDVVSFILQLKNLRFRKLSNLFKIIELQVKECRFDVFEVYFLFTLVIKKVYSLGKLVLWGQGVGV